MSYPLLCPLLRTAPGSTQPKVPMSLCTQAGRGITIVSPSSAPLGAIVPGPDFNKPLTVCSSTVPVNSQPAAVVTAAQTATGQQPKVPLHVSSQMTVNQARNAVRTGKFTVRKMDMDRCMKGVLHVQYCSFSHLQPHVTVRTGPQQQ